MSSFLDALLPILRLLVHLYYVLPSVEFVVDKRSSNFTALLSSACVEVAQIFKMRVRLMTRADFSRVRDIHNEAFIDDELFTWIFPRGRLYRDNFRNCYGKRFALDLCTPGVWSIVCVDEDDHVLGFSVWKRTVPDTMPDLKNSDPWLHNNYSWFDWFEGRLLSAQVKYEELITTNPAMDYHNMKRFRTEEDPCLDPIEKVGPHWYCKSLGVAPEAQRKGVGSKLLEWAIDAARKETEQRGIAVPLSLTASVPGKGLYLKKGFRIVAWQKLGLEGTFEGGAALIWDPTNTWIKPAKPETEVKPGRVIQVVWTDETLQANS